jgi:two-component system, NarL family, nitrate/nitrite response regulator NarL
MRSNGFSASQVGAPLSSLQGAARIRVLVLADIRLYREGIADVLGRSERVDVAGTAANVEEALRGLEERPADIVLVGLSGGGTLHAGGVLARARRDTRVVALAVDAADDVVAVIEAGVSGYVPREASLTDLVATIESVARGEMPCSAAVAAGLSRRLAELSPHDDAPLEGARLTSRELEILALVSDGLSNKEIAQRLCIEVTTVQNHVHNLLAKLGVNGRRDAAAVLRRDPRAALGHGRYWDVAAASR